LHVQDPSISIRPNIGGPSSTQSGSSLGGMAIFLTRRVPAPSSRKAHATPDAHNLRQSHDGREGVAHRLLSQQINKSLAFDRGKIRI
jgi:hypothetical protein